MLGDASTLVSFGIEQLGNRNLIKGHGILLQELGQICLAECLGAFLADFIGQGDLSPR